MTWLRRHYLGLEAILCLVLAGAFYIWVVLGGGTVVVDHGLATVRGPFYGALAAVAGALLGFVIATIAILIALLSGDSVRLSALRNAGAYQHIWKAFTSTIRWMGLATLVSLLTLLLDHESGVIPDYLVEILRAGLLFTVLAASVRLVTALIVLERLIDIVNKSDPAYTVVEG